MIVFDVANKLGPESACVYINSSNYTNVLSYPLTKERSESDVLPASLPVLECRLPFPGCM